MENQPEQSCNTCKYFDILRTKTGKPRKGEVGKCGYDVRGLLELIVPSSKVPISVPRPLPPLIAHGMLPDTTGCPTWEGKSEK